MKADEKLDELGIDYEEVVQDNPTKTCDDAAEERGVKTSQIVKSLIVEAEEEKFHVMLPGDRTLSEKKFGSEYRMVPPEESREITGFESGTVHPFSTDLRHIADERIFENSKISHTVGENTRGLIAETDDFRKALEKADFDVEVRDIAVSTEKDFREVEDKGVDEESAKFIVNKGYRKIFLELAEDFKSGEVLDLLKALNREEVEPGLEVVRKIIERAEDQTHMQRLVDEFSRNGELPEQKDYDFEKEVNQVIEEYPGAVEDYRSGQDSAVNFFIGKVMESTNGKADAGKVREILMRELE